jgi:hypothetical protein
MVLHYERCCVGQSSQGVKNIPNPVSQLFTVQVRRKEHLWTQQLDVTRLVAKEDWARVHYTFDTVELPDELLQAVVLEEDGAVGILAKTVEDLLTGTDLSLDKVGALFSLTHTD